MKNNYFKKTINLSESESRQLLILGDSLIEKGFLRKFTGQQIKFFLYLLTHFNDSNKIEIKLPLAAGALGMTIESLKEIISQLASKNMIKEITYNNNILKAFLNLESIFTENKDDSKIEKDSASGTEIRQQLIKSSSASENEIAAAIISFLPPAARNIHRREEIKSWLNDFENKMLKELVRRVDKWVKRQGGSNYFQGAYAYLKAIIDSWYQEEITTYKKLQKQDKLHRETRELARAYGIRSFSSNTAQLKTFQNWLSGQQALSKELALAAIQEAVRRKRDGQPSLKYIEDNFINPIKELGVNNLADFRRWLQKEMDGKAVEPDSREEDSSADRDNKKKKKKNKSKNTKSDKNNYKWKDFFIDFDKYKE